MTPEMRKQFALFLSMNDAAETLSAVVVARYGLSPQAASAALLCFARSILQRAEKHGHSKDLEVVGHLLNMENFITKVQLDALRKENEAKDIAEALLKVAAQ